jgi:alpha-D-ribose 1-methylphosphonate 5-triphosphate synthase subunit PhnH
MSKEETMVERVARAIAASFGRDPDECVHGSGGTGIESVCHMRMWETYLPAARAVIDALMDEPTPEMTQAALRVSEVDDVDWVNALFGTGIGSYQQIFEASYRAMLSKAKEGTGE